ncbi:MAG: exo-alpha-sialidase [Victivallales bacterium]|nr:exo-alpha-sialidase [Victivallales bacterium]
MSGSSDNNILFTVQDALGYNSWSFVQPIGKTLVCAYSRGKAHSISETCRGVYARRSLDGGLTWQEETTVINTATHCESAIGKGLDLDGALLLWVRCVGSPWHHDLYRSADGCSFERIATLQPNPMPMQITDVFHIGDGVLMSLWFAGNYRDTAENSWGTLTSQDNGCTWSQLTVEQGLSKAEWPTEPSCVPLGDGRLLAIARMENCGPEVKCSQFQLESEDNGRTWRKFRTKIDDVRESTPSLVWDAETGLLSNYYFQRGAGALKRRIAELSHIWNHPEAWSAPEIVCYASANAHHAGNVNACAFGDRHACTFYSGDEHQTDVMLVLS